MKRRHQLDEHENHERWVISYADFITLLFAFFVVMYSISSVNDGKYKVLSDSLVGAFNMRSRDVAVLELGDQSVKNVSERVISLPVPGDFPSQEDYKYTVEGLFEDRQDISAQAAPQEGEVAHLSRLSDQLALSLQNLIAEGVANVQFHPDWIEIDIQSSVLFNSGSAQPSAMARQIVMKVADLLRNYRNPVQVEGFTDNIPIQTDQFPSNWELSAARAAAVVRLFELAEIAPDRLAAVGFGEHRPVAPNDTEAGRARNRRVALIISRLTPQPAQAPPGAVDYKIGAGRERGARIDTREPLSRQQGRPTQVPLRVMDAEQSGILFSSEAENDSERQ